MGVSERGVTETGGLLIRQAVQGVDGRGLEDAGDGIADVIVDVGIPLHGRTGRQQRGERLDTSQWDNAVCGCPFNAGDCPQTGTAVTIAGRLATPGRTVDVGLTIAEDTDDGIIIVEQFAPLDIAEPERRVCALARAAFGNEGISGAIEHDA